MSRFVVAAVLLAACGGDDGGGGGGSGVTPDAANANKVQTVTCPNAVDAMVTTSNATTSFSPATQTLPKNAVVKFVMSTEHNVVPNPLAASTDPGLQVGKGQTVCLKFTDVGTFGFMCMPHGFVGTITVQ